MTGQLMCYNLKKLYIFEDFVSCTEGFTKNIQDTAELAYFLFWSQHCSNYITKTVQTCSNKNVSELN